MENMVNLFGGIYQGKNILLTGDTGFKGSWMAYWLTKMGANVVGFSKDIPSEPSHFKLLNNANKENITGDVADIKQLQTAFSNTKIDLVFHLAAQSLVRYSYKHPLETFHTNVMGTANIIDLSRHHLSVKGVVVVTSDKCYENFEDDRPYNETDRMGGYDPYSASKGCAELVTSSFRRSYFPVNEFGKKHHFVLASGRAGNVIGGGDWSEDRLIPDIVKNASKGASTEIRNPKATRPWQHVLEPISGYLLLGQKILEGDASVSDGWNFGPENNETLSVAEVLEKAISIWPSIIYDTPPQQNILHEAKLLRLDCTKAKSHLNWRPVWNTDTAIENTVLWYKNFYEHTVLNTEADLRSYITKAKELNYVWAK
jgi:CDP-glucose 4,6-dehydratase